MNTDLEQDEDVQLGREVSARRRRGSALLAVRVSDELLHSIQEYAQARGLTVSDVLRLGAEQVTGQGIVTAFSHTLLRIDTEVGGANVMVTRVPGFEEPDLRVASAAR